MSEESADEAEEEKDKDKDLSYATLYLQLIEELYDSGKADRFALIYIDSDDIPELATVDSSSGTFLLYCVFDGKTVLLSEGGEGYIGYSEYQNIIKTYYHGVGSTFVYEEISQGKLNKLIEAYIGQGSDNAPAFYTINEQDVTEEEIDNEIAKFENRGPFTEIYSCFTHVIGNNTEPYISYNDIIKKLRHMVSETNDKDGIAESGEADFFPKSGLVITKSNRESIDYSNYPSGVGEIILKNYEVDRKGWTIDGDDILFRKKRYKNLNSAINSIQQENLLPYSADEMIAFIAKVLYEDFESSELDVSVIIDPSDEELEQSIAAAEEAGGEFDYVSLDDSIFYYTRYSNICAKHNDKARWYLGISGNDKGAEALNLYGCRSFIVADSQTGDVTIDMGAYKKGVKSENSNDDNALYSVEVTAPDGYVNFRKGAGTDKEIIREISNGGVLSVIEENGKWLKAEYNGETGYVAKSQVTKK